MQRSLNHLTNSQQTMWSMFGCRWNNSEPSSTWLEWVTRTMAKSSGIEFGRRSTRFEPIFIHRFVYAYCRVSFGHVAISSLFYLLFDNLLWLLHSPRLLNHCPLIPYTIKEICTDWEINVNFHPIVFEGTVLVFHFLTLIPVFCALFCRVYEAQRSKCYPYWPETVHRKLYFSSGHAGTMPSPRDSAQQQSGVSVSKERPKTDHPCAEFEVENLSCRLDEHFACSTLRLTHLPVCLCNLFTLHPVGVCVRVCVCACCEYSLSPVCPL